MKIEEIYELPSPTQEMIDYYLGDDYSKWLPEILKDVFNNSKDFEIVKQEILDAWDQHLDALN